MSTLVLFGPIWSCLVHFVHFGPMQSIRSNSVHLVPIVDVTQIIFTVTLNYFYFVNKISSSITFFFFAMTFRPSNFAIGPLYCNDTLHGLEGLNSPPINDRQTK